MRFCSFFGNTNQSTLVIVSLSELSRCKTVWFAQPEPIVLVHRPWWKHRMSNPAVQWPEDEGGNGHWYQVVQDGEIDWHQSDLLSTANGGYLASITTQPRINSS